MGKGLEYSSHKKTYKWLIGIQKIKSLARRAKHPIKTRGREEEKIKPRE